MSEGAITTTEEIEELKKKLALLDGDRKAYYESSQWTMKKNKDTISKLREKNKRLRFELAKKKAGDEQVIDDAFREKDPQRHCAMRGMSGKAAITKLDQQVCEAEKKLNACKHQRNTREKKLEALETEYNQLVKDAEEVSSTDAGESAEAQKLRSLENGLDKMILKVNEAKKIKTIYEGLLEQLKEERRTWPNQLNNHEKAICAQREELEELNAMNHDAQIAREAAKAELTKLEQSVFERKKEREKELAQYKKQAEEKKDHAEKVEKRLQRSSLQQEDLTEQKAVLSGEEQERKITTYEEAMNKIKDTTGVSDIKEVVQRFLSQGDTQKHLETLKLNNEKMLVRLKEEKEKLRMEYEEMKYSGEAKLSSGQRMLEEFQQRLADEEKRCSDAKDRQERANKTLVNVKAGIEHLADKLQHLKAPKGHVPQAQLSPTSDEYILDLLGTCEQKLLKLTDDLGGKDISDVMKEMEDAEFRATMENKLPQYNTRVKLPTTSDRMAVYDDDEDSGEDEDVLSRNAIKRYSQQLVDSKTKKHKPRNRKRKTKQ
ncbi:outer dynein arm-docking complex subunit 3 [Pocillopora verrucosa]|uniref:outer dynein arm-docking complex subunit 3 n=1 Tax=Pocillopora verrucosa TaxID=203993 RepID=UPI00333FA6A5